MSNRATAETRQLPLRTGTSSDDPTQRATLRPGPAPYLIGNVHHQIVTLVPVTVLHGEKPVRSHIHPRMSPTLPPASTSQDLNPGQSRSPHSALSKSASSLLLSSPARCPGVTLLPYPLAASLTPAPLEAPFNVSLWCQTPLSSWSDIRHHLQVSAAASFHHFHHCVGGVISLISQKCS